MLKLRLLVKKLMCMCICVSSKESVLWASIRRTNPINEVSNFGFNLVLNQVTCTILIYTWFGLSESVVLCKESRKQSLSSLFENFFTKSDPGVEAIRYGDSRNWNNHNYAPLKPEAWKT